MAKRQMHKLTARFAETTIATGRHSDGGNLFLAVGDGGARSWVFLYRERATGRLRELGLGPAKGPRKEGLTLAEAREKAADARRTRLGGLDPLAQKRAEQSGSNTFGAFADELLAEIKGGFKNPKTEADWKRGLEVHCLPLRPLRLNAITTDHVLDTLRPLWSDKNKTARELRGKIERILDAAKAKGLRTGDNPARWKGHLSVLMDTKVRKKEHHAAAHYDDMPGIVKALREKKTTVNLALEFTVLTAARTNESRATHVREIDLERKEWRVPALRMKMAEDHVVPLCDRAVEILRSLIKEDAKPDDLVFEGAKTGSMFGENRMLNALKEVYPAATTHGCRSTFRDWAGDCTEFPREIAEMALAHAVGDEVEQAYRRGKALEKRRLLMDAWGAYVEGVPVADNVVPLARAG
jgi:integrase